MGKILKTKAFYYKNRFFGVSFKRVLSFVTSVRVTSLSNQVLTVRTHFPMSQDNLSTFLFLTIVDLTGVEATVGQLTKLIYKIETTVGKVVAPVSFESRPSIQLTASEFKFAQIQHQKLVQVLAEF